MSKRNAGMRHWMWLSGAVVGLSAGSALAGMVGPCGVSNGTYCAAPTVTGTQTAGDSNRDTTQAFAGINWAFGAGPELVVGVRTLRVDQRHRAVGARMEATFPFSASTFAFDKLRLRLVGGHRKGMYELGGGYSFAGQGFLLSGALQGDYVTAGTDFTLNSFQWQPFIGINTLKRAKAPVMRQDGTLGCAPAGGWSPGLQPVGTVQDWNGGVPVPAGAQINGFTCYDAV